MYDTPSNIAAINNSISGYIWGNIPTHEIDQAINWLDTVKADCDHKISRLKSVKRERERASEWRHKYKQLARDFMKDEYLGLSFEQIKDEVRRRYHNYHHINESHIEQIAKNAYRESQNQVKQNRNADIAIKRRNGVSVSKIAKEYNLSRQYIYDILKSV